MVRTAAAPAMPRLPRRRSSTARRNDIVAVQKGYFVERSAPGRPHCRTLRVVRMRDDGGRVPMDKGRGVRRVAQLQPVPSQRPWPLRFCTGWLICCATRGHAEAATMRTYPLHEARAEFSKLVERALNGEPQRVTRYGKEAVVIVSEAEWSKASGRSAATLGDLLAGFAERVGLGEDLSPGPIAGQERPLGSDFLDDGG